VVADNKQINVILWKKRTIINKLNKNLIKICNNIQTSNAHIKVSVSRHGIMLVNLCFAILVNQQLTTTIFLSGTLAIKIRQNKQGNDDEN
jgi:protocatechuate 3,4-dioxygenase beta subunit